MDARTLLVTGCSSGIGRTCALGMKARGWRVFATARTDADLKSLASEGLEPLFLDYRDSPSIKAAVATVEELTGGTLHALFNNGAYGQPGAVEDLSRAVLEEQFAANVFGWHELTISCLPLMRKLGHGRIVQNSSVLGITAMKWRGAYNASKFAIEGLTDTLRLELGGSGIHVSTINPGPIASRFTQNALAAFTRNIREETSHYRDAYDRQRARLGRGGSNRFKLPPEAVLAKLIHALENPRPRGHYYVTLPTHLMGAARRLLPQATLDWFINKMSDQ
jgi:NAD(P)-dependent dehydrogenase (short-subunit alcohol dehydrogenase family)